MKERNLPLVISDSPLAAKRFLQSDIVNNEFFASRESIKKLLDEAAYYHGTGARQYVGDKKNPKSFGVETFSSLESILKNGLEPKFDALNDPDQENRETISLGSDRGYARLYAKMNHYKRERLGIDINDRAFLFMVYALREIWAGFQKRMSGQQKSSKMNIREKWNIYSSWARSITKNPRFLGDPLRALSMLICGFSDIPGNFPVLIGIKPHDDLENKYGMEARLHRSMPLSQMSHIEVPYVKVKVVRKLVSDLGIALNPDQIVAMEFADLIECEYK